MGIEIAESEFQRTVIEYARLRKWRVAHFRTALMRSGRWATPVQGDGSGFPDLIIAGYGRIIAAELKSEKGRTTPEQEDWLRVLSLCGAETYVWRPSDWDAITKVLEPSSGPSRREREAKRGREVAQLLSETGEEVEVANLTYRERTRLQYWVQKALGKKVTVHVVSWREGADGSKLYTVSVGLREPGDTTIDSTGRVRGRRRARRPDALPAR